MRKIILLIALLFLFGCGSNTSDINKKTNVDQLEQQEEVGVEVSRWNTAKFNVNRYQ